MCTLYILARCIFHIVIITAQTGGAKIDVTGCMRRDGLFDLAASLQVSLIITCASVFGERNTMIYWLGSCQIEFEPLSREVFGPKAREIRHNDITNTRMARGIQHEEHDDGV